MTLSAYPPAGSRFVTKANAAGQASLGTGSLSVNLGPGVGPTNWVQLSASLSVDVVITQAWVSATGFVAGNTMTVQVGIGASGSEVAIGRTFVPFSSTSSGGGAFSPPLRVSAGQRLTVRLEAIGAGGAIGSQTYAFGVDGVAYTAIEGN